MVRRILDGAIATGIGLGLYLFIVELYGHPTTNIWLSLL